MAPFYRCENYESRARRNVGGIVRSLVALSAASLNLFISRYCLSDDTFCSGQYDGRAIEYNGEECQVIRDDNVLLIYTGVTLRLDNVTPVRDWVLIELDSKSNAKGGGDDNTVATSSGIVIAASVLKDNVPCEGRVVKVGEGRMSSSGTLTASPVQVGDAVKFKEYAGNDIMIEGKQYSVVKMVDILCTFTE
jgi:chaperonin GroES